MSAPSRKLVVAITAGLALVLIVIGVILWNNNTPATPAHPKHRLKLNHQEAPSKTKGETLTPALPSGGDSGGLFEGGGRTVTSLPGNFVPVATKPGETAAPATAAANDEREKALIQIDELKLMFRDYRTVMGQNPVGTNAEIMKAVSGGNPRGATLGPPEGQTLNPQGELVDRWGSPYFFHQLSGTQMEIRSAGPDKKLYTDDDLVQ